MPLHPRGSRDRPGPHAGVLLQRRYQRPGRRDQHRRARLAGALGCPGGEYQTTGGTSMATPHVVGVLALLAQANPNASATDLVASLKSGTFPLTQPIRDIGAGLLQAP
ncbi:S8 family serine peptidase [Streptomyces sp. NPDC001902]